MVDMEVINGLLGLVLKVLENILPVFGVDESFYIGLDDGINVFIGLLEGAGWFLPMNTLLICITAILTVKNFGLIFRIVMKIIGWITP